MGGDGRGTSDCTIRTMHKEDAKVFKKGNRMLIGYAGSYRMGQLLQYMLKVPTQPKNMDDDEFVCTKFCNAVIECFDKNKFNENNSGKVSMGNAFLVGYKGKLYKVYSDYTILKSNKNYDACGSGEDFAMASFHSIEKAGYNIPGDERVMFALEVAGEFNNSVGPPYSVKKL